MNFPNRFVAWSVILLHSVTLIAAQKPVDSLPFSEINIPIQISLKPIYALAEKNVDTVFASPNWPNGWLMADCATRYKYHFRRTPLKMSASGTTFNLSFTGSYKVVGSTRACIGSAVLSPWAPACHCGFEEGERQVTIGFSISFQLQPNYQLKTTIRCTDPQPLNKCSVCFWEQDITEVIMQSLKKQLAVSANAMRASFSTIDLRPYLLPVWQKLNKTYSFEDLGWLQINPSQLRINSLYAKNDVLNISLGLTTQPTITLEKPEVRRAVLPKLSYTKQPPGFNIFLNALLQYDSLNNIINQRIKNKRFDFKQGRMKKYVVIKNVTLSRLTNNALKIAVDFTGSYVGTAVLRGRPVYNARTKNIEIANLSFDIRSRNALLRAAKWLANDLIINELKKYSTFNLSPYYEVVKIELNYLLNKRWARGLHTQGNINEFSLLSVQPLDNYIMIRSNGMGSLQVLITEINW